MRSGPIFTAVALALTFAPVTASADDHDIAEKRLRGCLAAGAGGAPKTSLTAAVIAVRALCRPQIDTLAELRVRAATAGLAGDDAQDARDATIRDLNDEIAYAIATFTGLTY